MFDNISAIVYYDWTNENLYNFVNWKRQFNKFSFYLMAYWNPKNYQMPQQDDTGELFSAKEYKLCWYIIINRNGYGSFNYSDRKAYQVISYGKIEVYSFKWH